MQIKIKHIFINISEEPVDWQITRCPKENISISVQYTYAFSMRMYLQKNYPSDIRR